MTLSTSAVAVCCCERLALHSLNSRVFSIAITAWSANVVTSSICLSVNGRTARSRQRRSRRSVPSRSSGTPSTVRIPAALFELTERVFRVGKNVGNMDGTAFAALRAADNACRGQRQSICSSGIRSHSAM